MVGWQAVHVFLEGHDLVSGVFDGDVAGDHFAHWPTQDHSLGDFLPGRIHSHFELHLLRSQLILEGDLDLVLTFVLAQNVQFVLLGFFSVQVNCISSPQDHRRVDFGQFLVDRESLLSRQPVLYFDFEHFGLLDFDVEVQLLLALWLERIALEVLQQCFPVWERQEQIGLLGHVDVGHDQRGLGDGKLLTRIGRDVDQFLL